MRICITCIHNFISENHHDYIFHSWLLLYGIEADQFSHALVKPWYLLWYSSHLHSDSCHRKISWFLICTFWLIGPLFNAGREQWQDHIRQKPDQIEGWRSPAPASTRVSTSLQCWDGRERAARRREARTWCSRQMRWRTQRQGWKMPPQSGPSPRGYGLSASLSTRRHQHYCGRASESIRWIWILSQRSRGLGASSLGKWMPVQYIGQPVKWLPIVKRISWFNHLSIVI